ncbi:MAG: hypothetical protein HC803_07920 [Saprospiraceae bacterium]|nr:hypothetical protein [Saprospiraceae bacterium]
MGEKKISYDLDPHPKKQLNNEEAYIKAEGRQDGYEIRQRRRERLNNLHSKLSNPQTVNGLESEPAYMRRKVEFGRYSTFLLNLPCQNGHYQMMKSQN